MTAWRKEHQRMAQDNQRLLQENRRLTLEKKAAESSIQWERKQQAVNAPPLKRQTSAKSVEKPKDNVNTTRRVQSGV